MSVLLRLMMAIVFIATAGSLVHAQGPRCGNSPNIPLPDLTRAYRGLDFGLYPGRRNTPPDAHLAVGLDRARNRIQPLDVDGRPSPNGRIILLSLGMSNTSGEFLQFVADVARNPAINSRLRVVDAALGGADAAMWVEPNGRPWQNAIARAGVRDSSVNQVQVVWLKQTNLRTVPFPEEVEVLKDRLASILRTAKTVFPNLQIAYLSSRTRAGAESRRGPGEPQAYETAFAVKRLIQEQIETPGDAGPDAVWMSWGPYLWSNGTTRSDGFVWDCGDVERDMIHPTASGNQKVADQLMAFFMASETTTPWFLEAARSGRGPIISGISPSREGGEAPLTVDFTVSVSGATEYFWSFEDGTFSREQNPQKTFHVNGLYDVRLTVVDDSGNWAHSSVPIRVGEPAR